MLEDLRFAFRNLSCTPGFWILSVLILGLGVGANTTMYSTIRGLIFAPMEAIMHERSVVLVSAHPQSARENAPISLLDLMDIAEQVQQIEKSVGGQRVALTLTGVREAERLTGTHVTPGFLSIIKAKMELGRELAAEESQPGKATTLVISYGLWKRKFGGDPAVVGRSVQLDGAAYTVVGVARQDVWFPSEDSQFWMPLELDRKGLTRNQRNVRAMASLKPGATLEQANAEVGALSRRLSEQYPDTNKGWNLLVRTPYQGMVNESDRIAIKLVYLVTAGVLLIACANVANLLLARAVSRRREIAVRLALGATRWRLMRLSLIESLLLALPAAAFGVVASSWSGNLLVRSFVRNLRTSGQVIDGPVLLFTTLIAVVSTLAFALLPAFRAMKPELTTALKEGGVRSGSGPAGRRLASSFVVVQVALALGLLCFSSLLLRGVLALHQINPGFQTKNMAMVEVSPQLWKKLTPRQNRQYIEDLVRRVGAVPGVEAAAGFSSIPQVEGDGASTSFAIEGMPVGRTQEQPSGFYIRVTGGALEALRIPLLAGRGIENSDVEDAPRVAVINQTMARKFWNGDALGKRFRMSWVGNDWYTVIGVAADVKPANLLSASHPQVFVSLAQQPKDGALTIVARTAQHHDAVLPAIRQAVQTFDPDQPAHYTSVEQENYNGIRGGRTLAAMVMSFGGLALALAGVGLFALLTHSVQQRLREVGIRVALGAGPRDVTKLIYAHAARLVLIGLAFGSVLAFLLSKAAVGVLFSLSRMDAVVYGPSLGVLALVTLLACWVPARMASKADPASVLKAE